MCSNCCSLKCFSIGILIVSILIGILTKIGLDGPTLDQSEIGKNSKLCQQLTNTNTTQYQQFFMLNDGREIEYFHLGNTKSNDVLLSFHGVLSDGIIEVRNNKIFQSLNLNVISPSLPGWGMSEINTNISVEKTSIKHVINDIIELMDYLNYDKFNVIGYSVGGMYAMYISSLYPNRINKLGLFVPISPFIDTCKPFSNIFEEKIRIFFTENKYFRAFNNMITAKILQSQLISNIFNKENDRFYNYNRRSLCYTWKGLEYMGQHIASAKWDNIKWENIKMKTLIISHLDDMINPPNMQKCIHNKIKGSILKEYNGLNHIDVMNNSEKYLKIMMRI